MDNAKRYTVTINPVGISYVSKIAKMSKRRQKIAIRKRMHAALKKYVGMKYSSEMYDMFLKDAKSVFNQSLKAKKIDYKITFI